MDFDSEERTVGRFRLQVQYLMDDLVDLACVCTVTTILTMMFCMSLGY